MKGMYRASHPDEDSLRIAISIIRTASPLSVDSLKIYRAQSTKDSVIAMSMTAQLRPS